MPLSADSIRKDFPILSRKRNSHQLVYFDNACMSLRPEQVVSKVAEYYHDYPGCGGRSYHYISRKTTEETEKARAEVKSFINAKKPEEIVFTKNTTEALNLVYGSLPIKKGDVIITTDKEHNSNLLPAQMLVKNKGAVHIIAPTASADHPDFPLDKLSELLAKNRNVKLVSMVGTSNLDGTTLPIREVAKLVHDSHALFMVDGAQYVPHHGTDVKKLDVDFLAFSGHKMMGPSGTGVLYGKEELLNSLQPFLTGGETVVDSTYDTAQFEKAPHRFEAGLQNYAGIIGLGEAARYVRKIGQESIAAHEAEINKRITEALLNEKKLTLVGPARPELRGGIFSFNIEGMNSHDVAMILDSSKNIAIRSGAHCVHSWFNAHSLKGCARASFYAYNTLEEADAFVEAVRGIIRNIA